MIMKRIFRKFLVGFAMVAGCFSTLACSTPNFLWCTSNGIVTYNRHTGQFEMLWENSQKVLDVVHDTVYVDKEMLSEKP